MDEGSAAMAETGAPSTAHAQEEYSGAFILPVWAYVFVCVPPSCICRVKGNFSRTLSVHFGGEVCLHWCFPLLVVFFYCVLKTKRRDRGVGFLFLSLSPLCVSLGKTET